AEVLDDHLLDVAVLAVQRGDRLERLEPLRARLADADQDPGRERDARLAGEPKCGPPRSESRSERVSIMIPWLAVTSRSAASSSRVITPGFACGRRPVSSR